jgi:hypothetical protein
MQKILGLIALVVLLAQSHTTQALTFTNAKVNYVETRTASFVSGSVILIRLIDATTNQQKTSLCSSTTGATETSIMAVPLSDPAAKSILQMALTARLSDLIVIGNTLDTAGSQVSGYCQLVNFAIS